MVIIWLILAYLSARGFIRYINKPPLDLLLFVMLLVFAAQLISYVNRVPLTARIMDGGTKQAESEDGHKTGDDDWPPIGPRISEKSRVPIVAGMFAFCFLLGFYGFWLIYTSGRVEEKCVIKIPTLIFGIAILSFVWVIFHAALSILDNGKIFARDLLI